jgi:hypothetical protein
MTANGKQQTAKGRVSPALLFAVCCLLFAEGDRHAR